jgi:choline monooxygenase
MKTPTPEYIHVDELMVQPIEQAETLPSSWYTDPRQLWIENKAIFSREWQLVGHESQLFEAGQSICLTIAGNPILIFRDEQGQLRAFYNVCKHRGGPLGVKQGARSMLQCQYHGWTYRSDGSLRGVPHFNQVELFDKKDFGLRPVRVELWQGLVFVNLDDGAAALSVKMAGISERIAPIDVTGMRYHTRTVDLIQCNWKVYADNYLEGYHIPIVHPELAKLLDYSQYVTEVSEHYSLQYSPFADAGGDNPYRAENGEAWYYFVFPNIMLNLLPGRLQTNIIEPVGHDTCRVIFDFYYTDPVEASSSGLIDSDMRYSAEIQREDIEICEQVQCGLASDAYDKGRFSVERELGVWHFQSLIKRKIAAYLNDNNEKNIG